MRRMEEYCKAIKERVGAACLDRKDDGTCDPPEGRTCALDLHIPLIVGAVRALESDRIDDYARSVVERVCSQCANQDETGRCHSRDHWECCLDNFLYLVVDAVDEVDRRHEGKQVSTTR